MKTIKTLELLVTTREELWMQVYNAALEAGFSITKAREQTDQTVDEVFRQLGPKAEQELRARCSVSRLRPHPVKSRKIVN